MNRIWIAAGCMALLGGFAVTARANPIPIYNTGVGANDSIPATKGVADPHWQLVSTPTSSSGGTAYVVTGKAAGWATGTNSQWLAPGTYGTTAQAVGNYSYQTTFDLAHLQYATAQLTGQYAADDCLVDVLLNGVSTGIKSSGTCGVTNYYGIFTSFSITSGFIAGVNTLTFILQNAHTNPNPTGVDIQISGTALPAPEPASLGLLGLALLGLGGMWIRRRS